jgi:excisionase family DNA binding protein
MTTKPDFSLGVLGVKEAAAFIAVSRTKLWELMDSGVLRYVQDTPGGRRRVAKAELVKYLQSLAESRHDRP